MKTKTWHVTKDTFDTPIPIPEWQINADIPEYKKNQAIKDIIDGKLTARQAARHLGILAEKIVKK